jgi:hypothetical protein
MAADAARIDQVARALAEALDRPITGEVWPGLAAAALARFGDMPVLDGFAEKALETVADDERHDRLAISLEPPRIAVWFVAWSGTHREVQPDRYGEYLTALLGTAHHVVRQGIELAGFLEIDAYLYGHRPEADALTVDVELSFLPGPPLGYPQDKPNPFPAVLQLNPGLCTPEEMAELRRVAG